MADATYKRELVNRALMIFSGASTSSARIFFISGEMDTTYFSAPFTNVPSGRNDILAVCVCYEQVLKRVLCDLKPDLAKVFRDLGAEIRINKEWGDWGYLFELPSDLVDPDLFIRQVEQTDLSDEKECEIKQYRSYAHIVTGTDEQTYYCTVAHTASAATKPVTGADYASYWSLYDADDIGAEWQSGWSYKASETGFLLATNEYSNDPSATVDSDIESAYIEYIPYAQAGINDEPQYYTEHFKNAFCTRLGAELAIAIGKDYERRIQLLREYKDLAGPDFRATQEERLDIPERETIWEKSQNIDI